MSKTEGVLTPPFFWLDNSRIGQLERCPREFYFQHVLKLALPSSLSNEHTAFGKAFHSSIEDAFKEAKNGGGTIEDARRKALSYFKERLPEELSQVSCPAEGCKTEPSTGLYAIDTAFQDGGALFSLWQVTRRVLFVEKGILTPIEGAPNSYFAALPDLVVETETGLTLVDLKTTSRQKDAYAAKALADTQLHSYALALQQEGYPIQNALFAVLQVARRRLKSGSWSPNISTSSGIYPVALTENRLRQLKERMLLSALELRGRYLAGLWDRKLGACLRFGHLCPFQGLCSSPFQGEDLLSYAESVGFTSYEWKPFDVEAAWKERRKNGLA